MKHSEILAAARAVIEKPENWTQDAFARDEAGASLGTGYSEGAVCFCSLGALEKALGTDFSDALFEGAIDALEAVIAESIAFYNDTHTHSEVLDAFDSAIRLAKEMEAA